MHIDTDSYIAHNCDYERTSVENNKKIFKEYDNKLFFENNGFKNIIEENPTIRKLHIDIGSGAGWLLVKTAPYFGKDKTTFVK